MMNHSTPITKPARPLNQRLSFWLIILVCVIVIGLYQQHLKTLQVATLARLPVTVDTVKTDNVPIYLSALGNVTPTFTVTVKTQINGQLLSVLFKEGQMVKKGDLLAEIDPRPYQAQLTQYEGQLERDQALLANALVDLKRYQQLWKQDSISQQTLATQQSLVQQYEGAIRNDQGLIASAKINLIYCQIVSPIDGRVGLRLTDPGNFVQTSDTTGIAVITTLNPITVIFTLPEDNVPQLLPLLSQSTTTVKAYNRQQSKLLDTGSLLTIDNQVDTSTGTVKLRAQFANGNNQLFPNQFVNIQLLVNTLHDAMVIPTAAIQHGIDADFVYRLNENQSVTIVPIKTVAPFGEMTAITSALKKGQSIVIDGADKLTDGVTVTVVNANKTTPKTLSQRLGFLRRFLT